MSINILYRLEIQLWNVKKKRILRNATAPMNLAQGKVLAASV